MIKDKVQYYPFHAINDFMRDDYRLEVVRSALQFLPKLQVSTQASLDRLTRKVVHVPGFRNSAKAPVSLRIKATAEAFEKSPHMVSAILSAWAEANAELRQQVYEILISRKWEILPPEADRTRLPGFLTQWPKDEDFEALNAAFKRKFPENTTNSDDISLMTVWLSTCLPYQVSDEEETE